MYTKKKKCFPCKHGNPPCCLLLLYLKKHVVQLSTSVKTIPFFNIFILYSISSMFLISPHNPKYFMFYSNHLYTMRFFFILYLHVVFYFETPYTDFLHDNSQNRGNDHDNVLRVLLFFFIFFIWCHFVYLECF